MKFFHTEYGLYTISFHGATISFAGKSVNNWNKFYKYQQPYKKWFSNPFYESKSGYDKILKRDRKWFIFMYFIFKF